MGANEVDDETQKISAEQPDARDMRAQADQFRRHAVVWDETLAWSRFRSQYRVYMGLLLFVVLVGLPLVAIPPLRGRLSLRVQAVREAMGPLALKPPPAWAKVGENRYPFPSELARPVPTRPQYSGVIDMSNLVYQTAPPGSPVESAPAGGDPAGLAPADAAPEFRQGKIEQEAYDILLNSNATVAGLVKGSDPGLRFKTWSAARAEEDAFFVDLIFIRVSDNSELHYTWRVKPGSKEVAPLSHHARSLPKP